MAGEHAGNVGERLRMNKNFMKSMYLKYPWIPKQGFPTVGTVITVSDNEQDDVEIESE